ncbi:MAG: hypothetical protein QXR97_05095 [Thermoproteota archaeon]
MNPELRKRFVDSIEYLREMGFFQDYHNLSSEEILDKILKGEINYKDQWFIEKDIEKMGEKYWEERRREGRTYGQFLKKSLEEQEEHWIKASDSKVDLEMVFFDTKRVFIEDPETIVAKDMGIALMKKLARISKGVFNPTGMRESWSKWRGKPPPEVKKYFYRNYGYWNKCSVFFKLGGEKYAVDFYCGGDRLLADLAVKKINELIKDTGYQYYRLHGEIEGIVYTVFSNDEVEKLKKKGWLISLP